MANTTISFKTKDPSYAVINWNNEEFTVRVSELQGNNRINVDVNWDALEPVILQTLTQLGSLKLGPDAQAPALTPDKVQKIDLQFKGTLATGNIDPLALNKIECDTSTNQKYSWNDQDLNSVAYRTAQTAITTLGQDLKTNCTLYGTTATEPQNFNTLIQDVPGDGNCAAYALAANEVPRKTPSGRFLNRQGWMDHVKAEGTNLREQAARYLIQNPEQFLIPARFDSILESLNEADTVDALHQEIPTRLTILPQQRYDAIHALLNTHAELTRENRIELIKAYGEYIRHDKEYLDKPFFDTIALMKGRKIAILAKDPDHEDQLKVSSVHSPDPDNKALFSDENTLYVYFENKHYQWVNRTSPQFTTQLPVILNTHNLGYFNAKPNVMLLKGLQPNNHQYFVAALNNIKQYQREFYDNLCKWTYETFEQFRPHHNGHFYGVSFNDRNFGEQILDYQVARMHDSANGILNLTMLKNTFFANLRAGLTVDELKFVQI